ncbi:MAG: universal stress protein, partial [Nitrospirota bacterium]
TVSEVHKGRGGRALDTEIVGKNGASRDRHILIAVDESDNARRALLYAADFLGGVPGFRVSLLSIVPEPSDDYFNTDQERSQWVDDQRAKAEKTLGKYREVLIQSGFAENKVDTLVDVKKCPSVAECILDEQKKLGCCTVVVGRRGITKKEEFIFGSTSSKLLHAPKNCAVWVIE